MSLDLKSIPDTPFFIPEYRQSISMVVPTAFMCLDQDLGRPSLFDLPQTKQIIEDNQYNEAIKLFSEAEKLVKQYLAKIKKTNEKH